MAQVSVSGSNPGVQPSTSECPQRPVRESSSHELKHMPQHLEQRLKNNSTTIWPRRVTVTAKIVAEAITRL